MKKNKWIDGFDPQVKEGEKFKAIIKHVNERLNLPNEEVTLKATSDGYYIGNGPDELSYNWNIIKWQKIPKKAKKK